MIAMIEISITVMITVLAVFFFGCAMLCPPLYRFRDFTE